ncbi:DUF7006 family protein [Enterococcus sp. AZ012]|uniref:DUF7006 family protein n=1 Tax=unclassified Enterococcus TaxID=2608891 RepID=UPI003D2E2E90
MIEISDRNYYVLKWESLFNNAGIKNYSNLKKYINNLFIEFKSFQEIVNKENLWQTMAVLIGIDSKLNIIYSLLNKDDLFCLKEDQILEIVEKDYLFYTKESFGFKLNEEPNFSFLFNVK